MALGIVPRPDRDGLAPTPGPIAGGGLIWLGVIVCAGVYVLWRRRTSGR